MIELYDKILVLFYDDQSLKSIIDMLKDLKLTNLRLAGEMQKTYCKNEINSKLIELIHGEINRLLGPLVG